jgi:hypothetical protein
VPKIDKYRGKSHKLSSQLPERYLSALKSQWKKGPKGMGEDLDTTVRLFVQANHSSNLEEFLSKGILPFLGECKFWTLSLHFSKRRWQERCKSEN